MKKALLVYLTLIIFVVLAGCGAGEEATESNAITTGIEEKVIDVGLPIGEGSQLDAGAKAFGEKLEELTDGRLSIEIHYNNALGAERESLEGMGIGTIDSALISTGPIGGFAEEFFLFDLPYIFDNYDQAHAFLDSEHGEELAQTLEDVANVKVLAWMEIGFRNLTNSVRPINTPEDLVGIDHRTQESEVQIDTWTALGANATPMAWSEVFTGLQQGVIHSQENPIPTIYDVKFYEVQDYLTLTNHVFAPGPLMMGLDLFNSFSEEDQEAILEAAAYALPIQREASQEFEKDLIKELEVEGMEIGDPDLGPFKEAVEPVIEKWTPRIGEDLIDAARNIDY